MPANFLEKQKRKDIFHQEDRYPGLNVIICAVAQGRL